MLIFKVLFYRTRGDKESYDLHVIQSYFSYAVKLICLLYKAPTNQWTATNIDEENISLISLNSFGRQFCPKQCTVSTFHLFTTKSEISSHIVSASLQKKVKPMLNDTEQEVLLDFLG